MSDTILCVDLGGTKALVAQVDEQGVKEKHYFDVDSHLTKQQMNQFLYRIIDHVIDKHCKGIVVGVPSMVLQPTGVVIETINIPHWYDVPLKTLLENRFNLPVLIHNDANCFAMGEYKYSQVNPDDNLVGVCIGTGLGAGLILNEQLYTGKHSAAGEFGSFPYLDGIIEDYTSGQFFKNQQTTGRAAYNHALNGDTQSLRLFTQLGQHLAHAINQVILAFNPDKVVLGGSVAQSHALFMPALKSELALLVQPIIMQSLQITISELGDNAPLLGGYELFQLAASETNLLEQAS